MASTIANRNRYITRFSGTVGPRRGLPGERIIFEIDGTVCVTTYRVVRRQPKRWMDYYSKVPQVGVDVWLKDIMSVQVAKERYPVGFQIAGFMMFAAGMLGIRFFGLNVTDEVKIGVYMAQVLFYILGTVIFIWGQLRRRVSIVIGIIDYKGNSTGDHAFEVPLNRADIWRVNECVDTIRLMQHDFVMRQQRGSSFTRSFGENSILPCQTEMQSQNRKRTEAVCYQGFVDGGGSSEDESQSAGYHSADEHDLIGAESEV